MLRLVAVTSMRNILGDHPHKPAAEPPSNLLHTFGVLKQGSRSRRRKEFPVSRRVVFESDKASSRRVDENRRRLPEVERPEFGNIWQVTTANPWPSRGRNSSVWIPHREVAVVEPETSAIALQEVINHPACSRKCIFGGVVTLALRDLTQRRMAAADSSIGTGFVATFGGS